MRRKYVVSLARVPKSLRTSWSCRSSANRTRRSESLDQVAPVSRDQERLTTAHGAELSMAHCVDWALADTASKNNDQKNVKDRRVVGSSNEKIHALY